MNEPGKNEDTSVPPWGHNPAKNNAPVYGPIKCVVCGADACYAARGEHVRWLCSFHWQMEKR